MMKEVSQIKPFLSVMIVILTLFSLVFLQMEERRLGYEILKMTRDQRRVFEEKRVKSVQLARMNRPQNLEKMAQSRLTLRKLQSHQIIQLTGSQQMLSLEEIN